MEGKSSISELENKLLKKVFENPQLTVEKPQNSDHIIEMTFSIKTEPEDEEVENKPLPGTVSNVPSKGTMQNLSLISLVPSTIALIPSTAALIPSTAALVPSTATLVPSTATLVPSTASLAPQTVKKRNRKSHSNFKEVLISLRKTHISCPSYHHLVSKSRAKSSVWSYFGIPADENGRKLSNDIAICKLCQSAVSSKYATTSNIWSHLKVYHPVHFKSCH